MYGWLLLPFIAKKLPAAICLQPFWISFKCFFSILLHDIAKSWKLTWNLQTHTDVYQTKQSLRMCQCLIERIQPVGNCLFESHSLGVFPKRETQAGQLSPLFYLRSNLSWSTRRSANTLCWLSPYKHMFLVCSGGLCCLGLCNVLFDKAVVMQTCLLEIMFVYCQISFIITLWWQKAKSKA